MEGSMDERQEELMRVEEMPEEDRRLVNWTKSQWIEESGPSYVGLYPVEHAGTAPFVAVMTAALDVVYYWALRTGRMSLESFIVQFIVAGLLFMSMYSAGFLGVWYSEKHRKQGDEEA